MVIVAYNRNENKKFDLLDLLALDIHELDEHYDNWM